MFCGALPLPAWISRRNRAATMRIHIREPSNSICVCCCAFDLRVKRAFYLPLVVHRVCAHTPSDHHPQTPVDPEVRKVGLSNGFDLVGTPVASRLGSLALSTYSLLSGLSAPMDPKILPWNVSGQVSTFQLNTHIRLTIWNASSRLWWHMP